MAKTCHFAIPPSDQHRHQFIIQLDESRIGIDILDLDNKGKFALQGLQRRQHVITEVAISAGIKNEFDRHDKRDTQNKRLQA